MNPPLPKVLMLDLDDTILNDTSCVQDCWKEACHTGLSEPCGVESAIILAAIGEASDWFWGDPQRHRTGRLDLRAARREVVRLAFAKLKIENPPVAAKIADIFHEQRDLRIEIFPDAVETIQWFRERGCRLALLTNGAAEAQRQKISRFGLAPLFDSIFVEGEVGYGKPDERIYRLALDTLRVDAADAWMVGDNLEWDVAAPQRLGVFSIWMDAAGAGESKLKGIRPDRIIRTLSELRNGQPAPL